MCDNTLFLLRVDYTEAKQESLQEKQAHMDIQSIMEQNYSAKVSMTANYGLYVALYCTTCLLSKSALSYTSALSSALALITKLCPLFSVCPGLWLPTVQTKARSVSCLGYYHS